MAALSALLALVFISEVRHYGGPAQVEAQPTSAHAAPAPRNAVQSDSQVLPNQSFVSESRTPKPSPIANTTATKQVAQGNPSTAITQRKDPPSANVKKPRVRRNTDEDDYVAKDTYVFYGNAGKPHR